MDATEELGRPRSGCRLCRKRRVKCDGRKPTCRRCEKYGKSCPGYADLFIFRSENEKLEWKARALFTSDRTDVQGPTPEKVCSEGPVGTKMPQRSPLSGYESSQRASLPGWPPAPMQWPLGTHCDRVSLCYFMNRFVLPVHEDSFPGHLSFLPELYDHSRKSSFELAALCVAHMAAYNKWRAPQLLTWSFENYGAAVSGLKHSLLSEEESVCDKTIAAVLMLQLFMDISGERNELSNPHLPGIYSLLKRRGTHQLTTKLGAEVFTTALMRLHIHSFFVNVDSCVDFGEYAQQMEDVDHTWRARTIICKIPSLRYALCQLPTTFMPSDHLAEDIEYAQKVVESCFDILSELDQWDFDAIAYWKERFPTRARPPQVGDTAKIPQHYDIGTACVCIIVRAPRVILCMSLLNYLDKLRTANPGFDMSALDGVVPLGKIIGLLDQIQLSIADMLACVPYALGDRDLAGLPSSTKTDGAGALAIVWPLVLVANCPLASVEQIYYCRSILARIGSTMGIRGVYRWLAISAIPGLEALYADKTTISNLGIRAFLEPTNKM